MNAKEQLIALAQTDMVRAMEGASLFVDPKDRSNSTTLIQLQAQAKALQEKEANGLIPPWSTEPASLRVRMVTWINRLNTPDIRGYAKVFISYSRRDQPYVEQLRKSLSILEELEYITTVSDADLLPGPEYTPAIKEFIGSSDVILYMVSENFLNSSFITEKERVWAEERKASSHAVILPIYCDRCEYKETEFSAYNIIPRSDHDSRLSPINEWPKPERAYREIVRQLKRLIESFG
ncbi:toll/interleukin-1 receptor domain-containing protein [Lewinella sp. W8]|uniref:toll/interleukin-1 receptor domain-containing protein n=1 Tax=Lewinella sp. W8 TaxID=2528208 RepID=UPI00106778B5|nr:toll/interleukin-1 receptor domain-containing protein [Lewinella sp. W8]MTB49528.1 TIR domain-containing protein [Lewinella sp. W8]